MCNMPFFFRCQFQKIGEQDISIQVIQTIALRLKHLYTNSFLLTYLFPCIAVKFSKLLSRPDRGESILPLWVKLLLESLASHIGVLDRVPATVFTMHNPAVLKEVPVLWILPAPMLTSWKVNQQFFLFMSIFLICVGLSFESVNIFQKKLNVTVRDCLTQVSSLGICRCKHVILHSDNNQIGGTVF